MCFSYIWSKCTQRFSIWLKYLPETEVDSKLSSLMLEKCLVSLEKCSVLLEIFFKTYARDRSVIARNFLMIEMLDHFSARDRSDQNFKIKNCARDRSDRKIQCSKCSRSMFLPLGLNSRMHKTCFSGFKYLSLVAHRTLLLRFLNFLSFKSIPISVVNLGSTKSFNGSRWIAM